MTKSERLDAVVSLIEALSLAGVTVKPLSSASVTDEGELLLIPPAIAVYLDGAEYSTVTADGRLADDRTAGAIYIVAEDFAGGAEPAKAAYALLDQVEHALQGRQLSDQELLTMDGWTTAAAAAGKVALELRFTVRGHLQRS
ncbi:MAG: hypothetical protein GC160_02930 [Acidobacteria bacterium]|nr:hypothetical protein [Acidobacteriota bacterium]